MSDPRATPASGESGTHARAAARRGEVLLGVALIVEAIVIVAVLVTTGAREVLPVSVALPGADRVEFASVDAGAAVVALCALVGVFRVVPSRRLRLVEYSLTASIIVFLVAQLNGITDVGALVGVYALTSALALLALLQKRVTVTRGHPLLPLCFGAAVGIVPWGIIAFHQVGAGIVGAGPSVAVRLITLLMLGFAFAWFLMEWWMARRALAHGTDTTSASASDTVSAVAASVLAWSVVLGIVFGVIAA